MNYIENDLVINENSNNMNENENENVNNMNYNDNSNNMNYNDNEDNMNEPIDENSNKMNPYIVEMFDSIMAEDQDNLSANVNIINKDIISNDEIDSNKNYKLKQDKYSNLNINTDINISKDALICSFIFLLLSAPHTDILYEKISPLLSKNSYKNIIFKSLIFAILFIIIKKYIKYNIFDNSFIKKFYSNN